MRSIIFLVLVLLTLWGCSSLKQSNVENRSGTVKVEGAELTFTVEGQGPECIVIGSETYYRRVFSGDFKNILRCAFTDTRMFTPGAQAPPEKPYDMSVMVEDLDNLRQQLNWGDIIVIGHSLQAFAAIEYARTYPQNTAGVIMIGMAPSWPTVEDQKEMWESQASEMRRTVHNKKQDALAKMRADSSLTPGEKFIRGYILNSALYWNDPTFDATSLWEGVNVNMELFNEWVAQSGQSYELSGGQPVDLPVLVVLGQNDFAVPWNLWNENAKSYLNQLTFTIFEQSGHTPPYEEPQQFNLLVEKWINNF